MTLKGAVFYIIFFTSVTGNFYSCPKLCICPPDFTDCKYNNFSTLPFGLDKNVTILDLSYNAFQVFPDDLNDFPSLEYLNLSFNKIDRLENGAFRRLRKLERLDLSHNMIKQWTDIGPYTFSSTQNLLFLDLSYNTLRMQPREENPLQIQSLEILRLKNCSIGLLNNKLLDGLPKLKELHLSENPIRWLLSSLSSTSLKFLDLSRCNLKEVSPKVFVNLTSLQTLYMQQNINLKSFYCDSRSLRYLDISNCNLESIPRGYLPNLNAANFHGNHFRIILKMSFVNYTNLVMLDLSYNALHVIEKEAFVGLEKIERLDLSQNTLSYLSPEVFYSNTNLQFLNLSRNYLNTVPNLSSDFLEILDLSFCEIASVDQDCLINMPRLKILNLSKNIISLLPDNFRGDNLKVLDVSLCRIKSVNNKTFALMSSLRSINLAGNRLTSASPESFAQVVSLNISDNPWRCDCSKLKNLYDWLSKTGKKLDNLYCQSPEALEGYSWVSACQKDWQPTTARSDSVWWYTTGLIITVFVILFVILTMRRMYLLKEKRLREANEARRNEEREALRRMHRMQADAREEASRNAPDPRELQRPPSYNEALLLPRLDSSHPSLSASLHSIASKHSINGSLTDVAKKSGPRRKRRRRKSDSSEGQRASRVAVVDSDTSEHEPEPRTTLESDF
ncbi:nephrocan [Tribolium madens]|uniref:nephrocan n=1 Tax=Tribolium madens TaxID=41895 RepID=UPI001CF71FB6|nr:nephrocan [Tribolium madens]